MITGQKLLHEENRESRKGERALRKIGLKGRNRERRERDRERLRVRDQEGEESLREATREIQNMKERSIDEGESHIERVSLRESKKG